MNEVFLSVGSNIEPEKNIPACLKILKETFPVKKTSSIYETDPVGSAGNRKFWNLAVLIETGLARKALIKELQKIEASLGRQRDPHDKFAPRSIDLDIVPAPDYLEQPFVMIPLAEIAPGTVDPDSGRTFAAWAEGHIEKGYKFRRVEIKKE